MLTFFHRCCRVLDEQHALRCLFSTSRLNMLSQTQNIYWWNEWMTCANEGKDRGDALSATALMDAYAQVVEVVCI